MFCSQCGSQISDGASFCSSCGAPVLAQNTEPDYAQNSQNTDPFSPQPASPIPQDNQTIPVPQPASPIPQENQSVPTSQPVDQVPQVNQAVPIPQPILQPDMPVMSQPKSSKTGLIIAISVAAVAVIALIATLFIVNPFGFNFGNGATAGQSQSKLDVHISQVDNSAFPEITLYTSVLQNGSQPSTSINEKLFTLIEVAADGTEYVGTINSIAPLAVGDAMNINLVLDQSGSMNSSGKMSSAKAAANTFIDEITSTQGNVAEITSFDDYVYNMQPFSNDKTLLKSAVNSLYPSGETALYDALYWSLQRTNTKSGSRVVIAFTDGQENASHYTQNDVVELSKMTGIPVYIVGIGDSVNRTSLKSLASQCNGSYYDASTTNLQKALSDIYNEIYNDQRAMYRIVFTSSYTGDESKYRTLRIACADGSGFSGEAETTYMPVDTVSSFDTYVNSQDYVLPDSNTRYYTRAELEKMSLWELYLARNEIFARHGRGFKNQDLVEYFATKRWYHQTSTPEEFDSRPFPFNDFEKQNTYAMLEIEQERNSPYLETAK